MLKGAKEKIENILPKKTYIVNGLDKTVTPEELETIAPTLSCEQYRSLAKRLNVPHTTVQDIEAFCTINKFGNEKIVMSILQEWQNNNGNEATKNILKEALESIGRKDIANKVFTNQPEQIEIQNRGVKKRINENQLKRLKKVQLPQVPWTNKILPLKGLYINLELLKNVDDYDESKGEPMQLEELFDQIDGIDPVRILIEGGPGYGKTTLCLKLLNDFGHHVSYISSKFKMVFLFELRYFQPNETFEKMLKCECDVLGVNGDDAINCIKAYESEILLILDGFDEMNEECKSKIFPLIQKNEFPSMFVVMTSRKAVFEMKENTKMKREPEIVLEKVSDVEKVNQVWNKKILIKGVTADKIEPFMSKYLQKDYHELEMKIKSITEGELSKVFECPLLLILLAQMLEERTLDNVDSKTTLYKEFFNFIIRRNLIRGKKLSEEEQVDIFNGSQNNLNQTLCQLGEFAVESLCENKLIFPKHEILKFCKDEVILELGFLIKIPKNKEHKRENYYQPIHKSFLEFAAAFTMWNFLKKDMNKFRAEIERIGNKGLKPTNDSLFYVFLGGLLNSNANILFQSLTRYSLWFNIESLCFANILLEIQDILSFFPSFQQILNSFIPTFYSIHHAKGLKPEYYLSEIHSLMFKHSCDQKLINFLSWNSIFSMELSHELYVQYLQLYLCNNVFKFSSSENMIKCQNIICQFSQPFGVNNWDDFVSLFNSIESGKFHFAFCSQLNKMKSLLFPLFHRELTEGQWKGKTIARLRLELNELDDPFSVSLLVDLVKKNRINEGVHLWILESDKRTLQDDIFLERATEKLFNVVIQSKSINEFSVLNYNSNICPRFDFNQHVNPQLKSFYFYGSLILLHPKETYKKHHSFQELRLNTLDDEMDSKLIQNIQGIKYLKCTQNCFDSLVRTWLGLNGIEELQLVKIKHKSFHLLNSVSKVRNLQVLSLNLSSIRTIPPDSKLIFIHLFYSVNLRICEFQWIQNLEIFSFLIEVLMEGMKKKANDKDYFIIDSNQEKKRIRLDELIIWFDEIKINFNELSECHGIRWIRSMLRKKHLKQCCWVDYNNFNVIKSVELEDLFPLTDKFRISCEVNGVNPYSSRWSQFNYRWFSYFDRFCITFDDRCLHGNQF